MGLKGAFTALPATFKGLRVRTKRDEAVEEIRKACQQEASYDVTVIAADKDGLSLTPPPGDMAAPWAQQDQKDSQEMKQDLRKSVEAKTQQSLKGTKVADDKKASRPSSVSKCKKPDSAVDSRISKTKSSLSAETRPLRLQPTEASKIFLDPESSKNEQQQPIPSSSEPLQEQLEPDYQLPPAIHIEKLFIGKAAVPLDETDTPMSRAHTDLQSENSSGTVIVTDAHQTKLSLSLTASIEDYAKKADPANWGTPMFRNSQNVRIRPGTYPVPHKKLSEARSNYTNLKAFTKGKIHQIHKSTETRDPREFVADEGQVLYRVWVPRKVNSNVEFIFVTEENMTVFHECASCSAYATEKCGGCHKEWYCSEECLADDWKLHKSDCKHKGRTAPSLGDRSNQSVATEASGSSITPRPGALAPRRKFREDGTVKIINGYKPGPDEVRGHMTILPICLRPLTLDEEMAPPPDSRTARLLRAASHKVRRMIYQKHQERQLLAEQEAEAQNSKLHPQTIPEVTGEEVDDGESSDEDSGNEQADTVQDKDPDKDGEDGNVSGAPPSDESGTSKTRQDHSKGNIRRQGASDGAKRSGTRQGNANSTSSHAAPGAAQSLELTSFTSEIYHNLHGLELGDQTTDASATAPGKAEHQTRSGTGNVAAIQEEDSGWPAAGSEPDSPGAESLVEGQVPSRPERRPRIMLQQKSMQERLTTLPPICIRAEASLPQAKPSVQFDVLPTKTILKPFIGVASDLSMASAIKGRPKADKHHMRSDSLPEVFKRLTASSKLPSLGVRVLKDGSTSPTKKASGHRKSPFKRHHSGHRATFLSPPPSL